MTVSFVHLLAMSDDIGTFEHALYRTPRLEHGYCVDDVARVLLVVYDEPTGSQTLVELEQNSLRFVIDAQDGRGRTRNRRDVNGLWTSDAVVDDCWGRSVWAMGVASVRAGDAQLRRFASGIYDLCCTQVTTSPRAMAFAALGAEQAATAPQAPPRWSIPAERFAQWLDAVPHDRSNHWPWPEAGLLIPTPSSAMRRSLGGHPRSGRHRASGSGIVGVVRRHRPATATCVDPGRRRRAR